VAKNITLTLDENTLRQARIAAAQRATSVSGLVSELLAQAIGDPRTYEEVWAEQERIMSDGTGLRLHGRPLSRQDAHAR
jgi:hypothetical protein